MIRGLSDVANKLGLESGVSQSEPSKECCEDQFNSKAPREIPMMYRAQIRGRCSLQYAGNNQHLNQWLKEWARLKSEQQPCYQYTEPPKLGLDGSTYRIKVEFPFRLFSNSGQDSILRPVLGKNGVPCIPGSSIKGLFLRVCQADDKAQQRSQEESLARKYCGDAEQPGVLRFHSAYPVGNWAERIGDVVHPQENWQVKGKRDKSETALALISLYKPLMVFEFSSADPSINWQKVKWLLLEALQRGVGGKTSTGYGLGGNFPGKPLVNPKCPIDVELSGVGVSSVLRSGEPEFRPNLFKAALRGHTRRLLAGVCPNEDAVQCETQRLFGSTGAEGVVKILWQSQPSVDKELAYNVKGILYIDAPQSDVNFIRQVLKFAFTMGGFGRSWRRVWHKDFYNPVYDKKYSKLIGCHWRSPDFDDIKTTQDLKKFLEDLNQTCRDRLRSNSPRSLNWKEAWNPRRVAVYAKVVQSSQVIDLFHDGDFKTTPAIGGKNPGETRPTSVSCVWHRMLPLKDGQYLEIVTVFHGDRTPWTRNSDEHHSDDQLPTFIKALKKEGLDLEWGTEPMSNKK